MRARDAAAALAAPGGGGHVDAAAPREGGGGARRCSLKAAALFGLSDRIRRTLRTRSRAILLYTRYAARLRQGGFSRRDGCSGA